MPLHTVTSSNWPTVKRRLGLAILTHQKVIQVPEGPQLSNRSCCRSCLLQLTPVTG